MALYEHVVPKPKDECTKGEQLGVSFAAGYIAGVFCAVVSHPADNLVRPRTLERSRGPRGRLGLRPLLRRASRQGRGSAACVWGWSGF